MAEQIFLKKDKFLVRDGEESTEMYYLVDGTLSVLKRRGGRENQIGTIGKGELVGEMSFLDGQPRSASIMALTDCELTVIPQDSLDKVTESLPIWYQALIQTLLGRLRKANLKVKR